jgi:hypothetical protein
MKGTNKDIFLKTLKKYLFYKYGGRYNKENTIVIDDTPVKHILNDPENVVLLESWFYKGLD